MTLADAVGIASLAVSAVAVWLAVTLYRWSSEATKDLRAAANSIAESTKTLEKLFDKSLDRAFSMVDEAYGDIRKHAWPDSAEVEREETEADEQTARVVAETMQKVDDIVKKQASTEERIEQINRLVRNSVRRARDIESTERQSEIRSAALAILRTKSGPIRSSSIVYPIRDDLGLAGSGSIVSELGRMKRDGIIDYEEPLRPNTAVIVVGEPSDSGPDGGRAKKSGRS